MSPAVSRGVYQRPYATAFSGPSADGRPPSGGIYENALSPARFQVYRRSAFE